MHIIKIYNLGEIQEIAKYCPGNYGAPGHKRNRKSRETPERMKKQNRENRVRFMQRILIANFWHGGWHLVVTYRREDRPEDIKEAKAKLKKFLDGMRDIYKKAGYEFKYICVTERGSRGGIHHHLVIEDIADGSLKTKEVVAKLWGHGGQHYTSLYQEGEYRQLAEYLVKEEGKEGQKCSYTRSRNLIVPEPIREKVRGRWEEEPQAKDGWRIIKHSLIAGTNPATGLPYQRYMMRSLGKGEADGGDKDIRGKFLEKPRKAGWGSHVAHRAQKEWGAKDQGRVHPSGSRDRNAGNADGPDKCTLHPEKALSCEGEPGKRTCVKHCAQRLASAVAGKWLEKRQRDAGKKRRPLENVRGKSRTAHARNRERHP